MLATIECIKHVTPHPNADRLDIVTVKGYNCIVPRDMWQIGDLCVLIQPDTVLPDTPWALPYKKSSRVKAIRLRGEWSFGIVEKLDIVGNVAVYEGMDVATILGVTKYDPPQAQQLDAKGGLPFGIPKTDEERWQNVNLPYGEPCLVTLKVDGQSATYYWKDGQFGVTGRTLEYKLDAHNPYTAHIKRYDIEEKLRTYCLKHNTNLALRGESYGGGIQNFKHNPHAKKAPGIAFFAVWLIDEHRYESPDGKHNVWDVCGEIGLQAVPILERATITQELIERYANAQCDATGNPFEGVVIVGDGFSFKVINLEYDSKK